MVGYVYLQIVLSPDGEPKHEIKDKVNSYRLMNFLALTPHLNEWKKNWNSFGWNDMFQCDLGMYPPTTIPFDLQKAGACNRSDRCLGVDRRQGDVSLLIPEKTSDRRRSLFSFN
ncbi:hypothetical protein CEXT_670411 [Caerostris extrusa]|uniref:Uncharacterized protein n=1 Tax=Caerostris extrusa TaxID=172846 RepID=A0AAV4WGH3_CAEEX|nr:hypothetical protein CEXT_670411 [Caerostris extrusa]